MGQYGSTCINTIFISFITLHYVEGTLLSQGTTYAIFQFIHSLEVAFLLEDGCIMIATFSEEVRQQLAFCYVPASIQPGNDVIARIMSLIAFAYASMNLVHACLASDGTANLRNELSECLVEDWNPIVRLVVNVLGAAVNKPVPTARHFVNGTSDFNKEEVYFMVATIKAAYIVTDTVRVVTTNGLRVHK